MSDVKTRWLVAVHEAGHAVVGLLLAGDPTERAGAIIETHQGDGCAPIPSSLGRFDYIIAVAAGPVASELLEHVPVPPLPTTADRPTDVSTLRVFPGESAIAVEEIAPPEPTDPDEVRIAEACIEGFARQPWVWLRNYDNFQREARRMVLENRAAILAVAEIVFAKGCWIGSRDDLELLKTAPVNVFAG